MPVVLSTCSIIESMAAVVAGSMELGSEPEKLGALCEGETKSKRSNGER